MIQIKIGAVVVGDLQSRMPDDLPLDKITRPGIVSLTADEARALLADAEFNSDPACVDVGPYAMPRSTFSAYRRLRDSLRVALSECQPRLPPP